MAAELVERPLPKPSEESYVEARLLEAVTEARLALRFLKEGLTRNAAGKAFQAWRALLAALLRPELDKLKAIVKTDEERRWLETTAVLRVPTTKMRTLTNMLEELGHSVLTGTLLALELHDYQYHGPDPDMANSKYTTREEATTDIIRLTTEVARHVEALRGRIKWGEELEKAIKELKTSTLHITPETPPETAIDTTPRCAPHRRRGGEETMKPSTADAHTQKDATMRPSRRPHTPPQTAPPLET